MLPEPLLTLLGSLAVLSIVLGLGYLATTIRARRLDRQRADLLAEVGLLQRALLPEVPEMVGQVRTSVAYRPDRVTIRLDKTVLITGGEPAPRLDAAKLSKIMRRRHVPIVVDLGAGQATDRVLTCDLSRQYVTINADYHT